MIKQLTASLISNMRDLTKIIKNFPIQIDAKQDEITQQLTKLEAHTDFIKYFQAGNCEEYSYLALKNFLELDRCVNRGINLEIIQLESEKYHFTGDHVMFLLSLTDQSHFFDFSALEAA